MALYRFYNGPTPTTGSQQSVTTGTGAIKTLLQMKGITSLTYKIKAWGISFDGATAATPIKCDLTETGTVFATVTAAVAADINKLDAANPTSTVYFSVGTSATGYTASAEGTVTATRVFDAQLISPTNQYIFQWPLGQEPVVNADSSLRIRVNNSGSAVNATCFVDVEV